MLVTTAQEGFAAAAVGIGWINVKVFDAGGGVHVANGGDGDGDDRGA